MWLQNERYRAEFGCRQLTPIHFSLGKEEPGPHHHWKALASARDAVLLTTNKLVISLSAPALFYFHRTELRLPARASDEAFRLKHFHF